MSDAPSPSADPEAAATRVALVHGLTFRQAVTTVLILLFLGVLIGGLQLFLDWRTSRDEVRMNMQTTFALVEGSASEALYQLHPELGRQLIDGLFAIPSLQRAELQDNFGHVLASRSRIADPETVVHGWDWLFDDVARERLSLTYEIPGQEPQDVGDLEIDLDSSALARHFLAKAGRNLVLGGISALGIVILVVTVFFFLITRPLLRLTRAVAAVDPLHPGAWHPPELPGHERDELGQLLERLRLLLRDSQEGFDQRDRVQAQLTDLTHELESRVEERTARLAEQKHELERAFSDLAKANRLVLESIRYARRIQTAMLPDKHALDDSLAEIEVCWEPLQLVGGDWFWLERIGDRSLLLIADCTGHGVPGAFITLVVASALSRILHDDNLTDPAEILMALDANVRARLHQDRADAESDDGLEAAVVMWDPGKRELQYAGAGIPLLCVDGQGHSDLVKAARAYLGYRSLSAPQEGAIPVHVRTVRPGERFYLFTDGVSDHMGGNPRRLLGRRRFIRWLEQHAELPLSAQLEWVEEQLTEYRGTEPRRDDMTLIAWRPL